LNRILVFFWDEVQVIFFWDIKSFHLFSLSCCYVYILHVHFTYRVIQKQDLTIVYCVKWHFSLNRSCFCVAHMVGIESGLVSYWCMFLMAAFLAVNRNSIYFKPSWFPTQNVYGWRGSKNDKYNKPPWMRKKNTFICAIKFSISNCYWCYGSVGGLNTIMLFFHTKSVFHECTLIPVLWLLAGIPYVRSRYSGDRSFASMPSLKQEITHCKYFLNIEKVGRLKKCLILHI